MGQNDYGMGAKRPRVKIEAKRHGGETTCGETSLGAKRIIAYHFTLNAVFPKDLFSDYLESWLSFSCL